MVRFRLVLPVIFTSAALLLVGCSGADATTDDGGAVSCEIEVTGAPVSGPDDGWTWVPIPGAKCRDGSDTGFAINFHRDSDQVMIFLEGGGACFNSLTCGMTPSKFGEGELDGWKAGGGKSGVFDRANPANPVRDFNFVYVPYCTGDVHGGDNPGGTPERGTPQQFVGYANIGLYLQSIVATFPKPSRVLLTGVSAGGFGAALNYDQVQRAFGCAPVDLIDDSAPPLAKDYLPVCLQSAWRDLWGFDRTVLADCGADCPSRDDFALDFFRHLAKRHAGRFQGLIDSTKDQIIRNFYGFGADGCETVLPNLPAAQFTTGLMSLQDELATFPHFGTFFFVGNDHTSLGGSAFYTRTTGDGASLTDWVASLLAGQPQRVGP